MYPAQKDDEAAPAAVAARLPIPKDIIGRRGRDRFGQTFPRAFAP